MEDTYQGQPYLRFGLLPIVFAIIQVILIALLAFSITSFSRIDKIINTPDQGLVAKIDNISDAIPEEYSGWHNMIEWALLNTILGNKKDQNISKDATLSYIREGSIKAQYFEEYDAHYVRMIVDVPELEESYEIFLEYPDNKEAVNMVDFDDPNVTKPYSILCVEKAEMIYPDFDCRDSDEYFGRQRIVANILRYFDFDNFAVAFRNGDWSTIYITPSGNNISESIKKSYIQEVRKAINSLGISSDMFSYQVVGNLTNMEGDE